MPGNEFSHTINTHDVSRETFGATEQVLQENKESLEKYLERLLWWNKRVNLVSRDVSRETLWDHIRHSLLLTTISAYKTSSLIIDSGTGGGLPGLPLAIADNDKEFVLNDIVTKKIMAVKQICDYLKLSHVSFFDDSVEYLPVKREFLLVSKHAFKIDEIWNKVKDFPWSHLILYKGIEFRNELTGLNESMTINCYRLDTGTNNVFFKNKAIIVMNRHQNIRRSL